MLTKCVLTGPRGRTSLSGDWVELEAGELLGVSGGRGSVMSLLWTSSRLLDSRTKVFTAVFYHVPHPSSSHCMSFPALGMSLELSPHSLPTLFYNPIFSFLLPSASLKSWRNPFPRQVLSSLFLTFHHRPRGPIRPDPQSTTGQVSLLPEQAGPDLPTFSVGKDKRPKQKQLKFHFTMV